MFLSRPLVISASLSPFVTRLTSVATLAPYVLHFRLSSSWGGHVSLTPRPSTRLIAKGKALISIATKVSHTRFRPTHHTDQDPFRRQSYALAAFTILFYDYLLTLADEVCQNHFWNTKRFPVEITYCRRSNMPGLERDLGVRPPLGTTLHLTDLWL